MSIRHASDNERTAESPQPYTADHHGDDARHIAAESIDDQPFSNIRLSKQLFTRVGIGAPSGRLFGLSFAAAVSMLAFSSLPASAFCILGFIGNSCDSPPTRGGPGGGVHPVPGPLAGLPFLAVYSVYWLVRRRRNSQ
jgi:hypothetical protein